MAVVYAVMLELGFNKTDFGKAILAACFVNDLGTVIALGLIFSPFTFRTLVFVVVSIVVFVFCRSSHRGSFEIRRTGLGTGSRNSCCSSCLRWAAWRFGRAAKLCCLRI